MGVKVKTIKDWIKNLDDEDLIEFSCGGTHNWNVAFLTTADSNGNHTAEFELHAPLDPNITYVY